METTTAAQSATTVAVRVAEDVARFDPTAAKLLHYRQYLSYTINGISDKDGAAMVGSARKEVKAERVALEKLRKAFVDDAVQYQSGVNASARAIREELEKVEAHLLAQEAKVESEKERVANEAIEAARRVAFEAEAARRAGEVAAMEAERQRIAAERAKMDEERAALDKARLEQDARERKIQEDAQAVERAKLQALEAQERKVREAAEAKRQEEQRVATEARIAREREEAATAERQRIEAAAKERVAREEAERIERDAKMSDKSKMKAYCAALMSVPVPEMKSKAGAAKVAALATKLEEITSL